MGKIHCPPGKQPHCPLTTATATEPCGKEPGYREQTARALTIGRSHTMGPRFTLLCPQLQTGLVVDQVRIS